jgi:hypothetical protein
LASGLICFILRRMGQIIKLKGIAGSVFLWIVIWFAFAFLLGNGEPFDVGLGKALPLVTGQIALVLLNIHFFLPRFFLNKKYFFYTILIIPCIFLISYLISEGSPYFYDWIGIETSDRRWNKIRKLESFWAILGYRTWRIFPYIVAVVVSSLYKTAGLAESIEKEAIKLQKEKLETEMKLLKSQINPHFLFNTLNNIYALSIVKAESTPEILLKLSDMLRYILYECNADRVNLANELTYIKNYIDLKRLKDSKGLNISLNLEEGPTGYQIAPMILIPFIENAFKHSNIENLESGWIKIDLKFEKQTLNFTVENTLPETPFTKDQQGGIGLKNVKRHLELLYPDKHNLEITNSLKKFSIALKIWQ